MKSVKLKLIKVKSLAEIFQSLDIKFSFVNKNMEQVTVPAKCRDFLGDCIFSRKRKTPVYIYGFSYNYVENPFDDCRFSLKFPDGGSYNNFISNLGILHEKEKHAGVKLSKIYTTDQKDTLIVEGSNYWTTAIWKISLYTFYLKLISYKSLADLAKPEDSYTLKLTPHLESVLLSKVKNRKFDVDKKLNCTSTVHNVHGFYSVLTKYHPKYKEILGDIA